MRSLLVITQLDYRNFANTRTQHIVRHFAAERVTVVSLRHRPQRRSLWRLFTLGLERFEVEGVEVIEVTPIMATEPALGISLLGIANPYAPGDGLRIWVGRLFSLAGLLRDFLVPLSLLGAYLLRDRARYDICISEGPWAMLAGHALRRLRRSTIHVIDDYDYSPGIQSLSRIRRWVHKRIEAGLLRRADLVVSVGELLAELRRRQTGREVFVIPNGIDVAQFVPARDKRPHLPTALYCGAVEEWSGLDMVVRAWPQVLARVTDAQIVIAGHATPSYEKYLLGEIRRLGLNAHVHLLGPVAHLQLPRLLATADVGLAVFLPIELRKYAFSLKVIEYMAAGVAVLTTADSQSALLVRRLESGRAVDYDCNAIGSALGDLLADGTLRARYAANGARASSQYDWAVLMARFVDLVDAHLFHS